LHYLRIWLAYCQSEMIWLIEETCFLVEGGRR
jgi:hypothetical protein